MIGKKLILIVSPVLFLIFGTVVSGGRLGNLVGPLRYARSVDGDFPLIIMFGDEIEYSLDTRSIQGSVVDRNAHLDFIMAKAVTVDVEGYQSLKEKMEDGSITKIERDVIRSPETLEFSSPRFESRRLQQYNLDLIQATEAHRHTKGYGAKICLIDSGVDFTHKDLDADIFDGINLDSELQWNVDLLNHGTFLAGIISAIHDNALEFDGIAPEAEVLVLRIFDSSAETYAFASKLVAAVRQCAIAGAKIINLSLGGVGRSELEQEGLSKLVDEFGLLLVAAGGNYGYHAAPHYPASYQDVISVGAINKDKVRWSRSQKDVDIVAPGVQVRGIQGGTQTEYVHRSGTSIACVHISAVAALLWSWKPDASVSEIKSALFNSAEFLESPGSINGKNAEFGHGMVQVMCALIYLNDGAPLDPSAPVNESCPPFDTNPSDSPSNLSIPVNLQGCSICGNGKKVTAPEALFTFPGQPSVPCGVLETAGSSGEIPLDQCAFLPTIVTVCECAPTEAEPFVLPVTPVTSAPNLQGCSVCGDGEKVTAPDAIFTFPGQPSVPCGILERAGSYGAIPPDQCAFLPSFITACECAPVEAKPACSICGDGKKVTAPNAIFTYPGQLSVPCGVLETDGSSGGIPLDECGFLPPLVTACECAPTGATPEALPFWL